MGLQVSNKIGIEKETSELISAELNELLANYQVFYMNVRGFHWNIKGDNFFDLHAQYELLYTDLLVKIDEIAERILSFGEVPLHSYQKYLVIADIKGVESLGEGKAIAESIIKGLMKLLTKQRQIAYHARKHDDEGTYNLITTYIKEQEKQVWQYNAFLGQ